ncbi:unnamed protein product [marine sediment metagenome]|uniref:Uncharacterized protein n=1 Tax=marine sediment metagenome TaxID=412755 RepID=X0VDA0_9ZZZZ
METKKIAGLGLLTAAVVAVIYIVTQEPTPEPELEPKIDMTLTWDEIGGIP